MGAVLHTLNLRLPPGPARAHHQPRRGQDRPRRRVAAAVAGRGRVAAEDGRGLRRDRRGRRVGARRRACPCTPTPSCSPARPTRSTGRSWTRSRRRRCVTRAARPATRRASSTRTARLPARAGRRWPTTVTGATEADRALVVVPMFHVNAWGIPYASFLSGATMLMPGPHMTPGRAVRHRRGREGHADRRRPDAVGRHPAGGRGARTRPLVGAHGHVRRRGDPALADGGVPGASTGCASSRAGA